MEIVNKIIYKSGDGESWIEKVYTKIKEGENTGKFKRLNLSRDEIEDSENKWHHIVFHHDHDDNTGYGVINLDDNGTVIEDKYQEE